MNYKVTPYRMTPVPPLPVPEATKWTANSFHFSYDGFKPEQHSSTSSRLALYSSAPSSSFSLPPWSTNFSLILLCSLLPHPVVRWFSPAWFYYTPNSGFQLHHFLCPTLVTSNFPPSNRVTPSGSLNPFKQTSLHQVPSMSKLWEQELSSNFSCLFLHLTAETWLPPSTQPAFLLYPM